MGSKLFPQKYNGKERSGGYLTKNRYRGDNARAPDAKGRVYVVRPGWHWLAGWTKKSKGGSQFMALQLQDMTDDEAKRYCAQPDERNPHHQAEPGDDSETTPTDIPF